MFEPSFFDQNRLFGFYHPARDAGSDRLLIICPPLFDEYRRLYKALAELAKGCASEGTHVFRFDYFGTGESWGMLEEASAETWVSDIRAALEEGLAISGASRVYLLGVRFSATLAAQVHHSAIVEYIFWDALCSGDEYLAWLAHSDTELEKIHLDTARFTNTKPKSVKYEGFHLSPALREGLRKLRVDMASLKTKARVHQIVCRESETSSDVEYSGFPYDWPTYHDGLLLPKPVLEAIARRLV